MTDTLAVKILSLVEPFHQMAVAPVDLWGCLIGTLIILGLLGKVIKTFRKGPLQVQIVHREEVCWYHRKYKSEEHRGCGCPKDPAPGPRE